jgi:peptidoglycan/LPS O-acetylase OafA/YrhL
MLQRIQSVFLFLASGASFGLFGLPFASTDQPIAQSDLFADSAYTVTDNIALMILFIVAGALSLGAIFLFKNRPLQINLSRVAFVASIVGLVLGIILFINDEITKLANQMPDPQDGIGVLLPIVAAVMLLLAMRAIGKDEKLVRSSDRLR